MGNESYINEQRSKIGEKLREFFSNSNNVAEEKDEISKAVLNSFTDEDKKNMENYPELKQYFNKKLDKYFKDHKNEKKISILSESLIQYKNQIINLSEKEMKNKEEYEKREKEHNQTIKFIIEQHQQNMNSFRKEASEQSKKQQEQYEKSLKILEQRIKEEKDEEKKKLILEEKKKAEELQEKKLKNQKEFDEKMKNTLTFDIDNLLKSFTLNEDNFCKEDISKFDANKINKLIIDLVKEEKIVDYTLHQLNLIMEEIKDKIKDVEHLNIILVGPSGVGKSTLINAILELKTQTLTGFGNPQTQNIEFHTSDKIPFLRLADSKGIEKNESSGVDAVYNSIKDFIKLQIETRDPDKYIHCIWYCWTGTRLEDTEVQILKKLSEQYTLETLPIIIVYTNAIDPDQVNSAKKYINDELKLKNEFIDILALEKNINIGKQIIKVLPFNLDKLKEISIKSAMSAINSSCYEGLLEDIKIKIKEKIDDLSEKLKISVNSQKREIAEISKNCNLEEFVNKNTHYFLKLFYKYFFLSPEVNVENIEKPEAILSNNKYSISEYIIMRIKDLFTEYFKECLLGLEKNIQEILQKESQEMSKKIYTLQLEYFAQHENLLELKTNIELENIIKKEIKEKLYEKAKSAALKNSFLFISEQFIQKLGEYFDEFYKKGMTHPKFRENANNYIKIPFDKIEQKIKEYEGKTKENNEQNAQEAPAPIGTKDLNHSVQEEVDDLFSTN